MVTHYLKSPVIARYVRFRPMNWFQRICMRVEIYGCKGISLYIYSDKLVRFLHFLFLTRRQRKRNFCVILINCALLFCHHETALANKIFDLSSISWFLGNTSEVISGIVSCCSHSWQNSSGNFESGLFYRFLKIYFVVFAKARETRRN